jgi:hypothetical protein
MLTSNNFKRYLAQFNELIAEGEAMYSGSQKSEVCPIPYPLCPMPYALCPVVPHLSEKGYTKQ